ncbi:MAG: dihydroneopterin aldolase family protein [Methanothrix sp.]
MRSHLAAERHRLCWHPPDCRHRDLSDESGGDLTPTKREIAAFEAGIKLGALYHQFVGSPVSAKTASSLETAMQQSISLQPYVRAVKVTINREMLKENVFGYGELEGRMIIAEVEIDYEGEVLRARLEYDVEKSYPLMRLV